MKKGTSWFPIPMTRSTDYTVVEVSLNGDIFKMHLTKSFMKLNGLDKPPFPRLKNLADYIPPKDQVRILGMIRGAIEKNDYREAIVHVDYWAGNKFINGMRRLCIWPQGKDRAIIATIIEEDSYYKTHFMQEQKNL
jgi:hypothetical protein